MLDLAIISKAAFLGVMQGLGEFLPISSTGHLIIFEKLFGLATNQFGLSFDAFLHLGTLLALLWFFKSDLWGLTKGLFNELKGHKLENNFKLTSLLIIGTTPAAILGFLLESKIETAFRSPFLVALSLIGFSLIILLAEKMARQLKTSLELKNSQAFLIGLFQSLALIPGISRSGATIVSGLLVNLKEQEAARFSFLLSIPIVAGAGFKKLLELKGLAGFSGEASYYLTGFLG